MNPIFHISIFPLSNFQIFTFFQSSILPIFHSSILPLSNYLIVELSHFSILPLPNYLIVELSHFHILPLSNCRIFKLSHSSDPLSLCSPCLRASVVNSLPLYVLLNSKSCPSPNWFVRRFGRCWGIFLFRATRQRWFV